MKEELTISLNCANVESLIRSLTKFDTFLEFYIQENFSRREVYIVKYFIKTYKQNTIVHWNYYGKEIQAIDIN